MPPEMSSGLCSSSPYRLVPGPIPAKPLAFPVLDEPPATLVNLREGAMRITKIDHLAFATGDVDSAAARFENLLGRAPEHREIVADQKVDAAMIPVGETCVELIAPVEGNESLRRFLDRRGPGLHHVCVEVEDIDEALSELRQKGAPLIDEKARIGARGRRIAFVHPRALGGVLLELVEKPR